MLFAARRRRWGWGLELGRWVGMRGCDAGSLDGGVTWGGHGWGGEGRIGVSVGYSREVGTWDWGFLQSASLSFVYHYSLKRFSTPF